jgi:hypothetical protein
METENRNLPDANGRYGSSDYEDESELEHLKPVHWPWLVIIALSSVIMGVAVALMLG